MSDGTAPDVERVLGHGEVDERRRKQLIRQMLNELVTYHELYGKKIDQLRQELENLGD